MAQLMPLPLTVSCFSKIQISFTFLVLAHLGSPGKRAVKRVCVCVCIANNQIIPDKIVTSLCWALYLGSQHDATHSHSLAAYSYWLTASMRHQPLSINISCMRRSLAIQPHAAAADDRRDRQTDKYPTIDP